MSSNNEQRRSFRPRTSILKIRESTSSDPDENPIPGSTTTSDRNERRVSFAKRNSIKPFASGPENNTLWDNTYEELLGSNELTPCSNQEITTNITETNTKVITKSINVTIGQNVTSTHSEQMEIATNIVQFNEGEKENYVKKTTFTSKMVEECVQKHETNETENNESDMDLTGVEENHLDITLMPKNVDVIKDTSPTQTNFANTLLDASDMQFTCQMPININSTKRSSVDMTMTCQTINIFEDESDIETNKNTNKTLLKENDCSLNSSTMEFTCQMPVNVTKHNIEPVDVDFEEKNCTSSPSTKRFCQNVSMPCQTIKIFEDESDIKTNKSTNKTLLKENDCSLNSSAMEFTCQMPVNATKHNIEPVDNVTTCQNIEKLEKEPVDVDFEEKNCTSSPSTKRFCKNVSMPCQTIKLFEDNFDTKTNKNTNKTLLNENNCSLNASTMEFTCQMPVNTAKHNIEPVDNVTTCQNIEKLEEEPVDVDLQAKNCSLNPSTMEFMCQIPVNTTKYNKSTDLTCKTMKMFKGSDVNVKTNANINESIASDDMQFTCQMPVNAMESSNMAMSCQTIEMETESVNISAKSANKSEFNGLGDQTRQELGLQRDKNEIENRNKRKSIQIFNFSTAQIQSECVEDSISPTQNQSNIDCGLFSDKTMQELKMQLPKNVENAVCLENNSNTKLIHETLDGTLKTPVKSLQIGNLSKLQIRSDSISRVNNTLKLDITQNKFPLNETTSKPNVSIPTNITFLKSTTEDKENVVSFMDSEIGNTTRTMCSKSDSKFLHLKNAFQPSTTIPFTDLTCRDETIPKNIVFNEGKTVVENSPLPSFRMGEQTAGSLYADNTQDVIHWTYTLSNSMDKSKGSKNTTDATTSDIKDESSLGVLSLTNCEDELKCEASGLLSLPLNENTEKIDVYNDSTEEKKLEIISVDTEMLAVVKKEYKQFLNFVSTIQFNDCVELSPPLRSKKKPNLCDGTNKNDNNIPVFVSLMDKILKREKEQKRWKFLKKDENLYIFKAHALTFAIVVNEVSNRVENIEIAEKDDVSSTKLFSMKYFIHRIENIESALGKNYDLMSFLDYVEMSVSKIAEFEMKVIVLTKSNWVSIDINKVATRAKITVVRAVTVTHIVLYISLEDMENISKNSITIKTLIGHNQSKIIKLAEQATKGFDFIVSFSSLLKSLVWDAPAPNFK